MAELEQLMSTMLYLRGEGDGLPSMHHFGKHALREFMYKSVFGMDDGSSALSRHNPFSHVDIAGHRVTRKALHDEITRFVEEQVDLMTASSDRPGQNHASPMAHALSDRDMANRAVDYSRHEAHSQYERNCFEPMPQLGLPGHGPARLSPSPIQGFDNLNLGGHQNHDSLVRPHSGMMPAAGEAHQGSVTPFYGQPPMDLHQQQYFPMLQQQVAQQSGHFVPQQFITPQGMVQGPSYLPQQAPTLAFYPGRPINPYAGQMNPYAAQFLPGSGFGMHQLGTPIMQPQLLPNFQPAMGGLPPHMASFASAGVRPMQQYGPQWPQVSGRVYVPSSRTSSPVPRAQSRGGRSVVSDVLILPYRPGSDDMYPHVSAEGTSVRLQELQRQGPSYAVASRPENLPFIETARRTRPAEWGVLRIGNVSRR